MVEWFGESSQARITFREGHLFGAVNGLFWALYYKDEGPQRKKYSWELEEDVLKSLKALKFIMKKFLNFTPITNQLN